MDFVSRFTERIGSRTGREVARKKKKEKEEKEGKKGERRRGRNAREERSGGGDGGRGNMDISVSLFIVLGYLITMTGGERALARLSVLACAKNSQDEARTRAVDGGAVSRTLREDRATQ